ncbi:MAG TPA: TonB-dependent receptor [Sphingobium sp.]
MSITKSVGTCLALSWALVAPFAAMAADQAAGSPAKIDDQTANPPAAQPDAQSPASSGLEEIIVTAERRESKLQQTPLAVTAFTSNFMRESGASDVRDLARLTPGLVIGGLVQLGTNPVSLRGIGSNPQGVGSDDSVATYLDGVYLGRAYASVFDLVDTQRIEVLRGPQGTLYGRNATGGAISIITRKPSNEPYFAVDGRVAERNEYRVRGVASGALVEDKIFAQLSAAYATRDGYSRNAFDGKKLNGERSKLVRGTMRFVPTDQLEINVSGDYGTFHASPQSKNISAGDGDPDDFNVNVDGRDNRVNYGGNVTADYDFGFAHLTSITAYRRAKLTAQYDSDGTAADILSLVPNIERQQQFSEEIRLASNGRNTIDWLVGAYYYHEKANSLVFIPFTGLTDLSLSARNQTKSYAAFGQSTWHVDDRLSATVGLRYSRERKSFDFQQIWDPQVPGVFETAVFNGLPIKESSVTPKFVVDYKITPKIFAYASVSKGFKSGGYAGYNIVTPGDSPAPFKAENLWAYETGLKMDGLFNNTTRLNVSAFYYDYTDLQVRVFDAIGFAVIKNAGTARVKGAEFELTTRPVDPVTIFLNGTFLDAKYKSFSYSAGAGVVDNSGNSLARSPKLKLGAAIQYTVPLTGDLDLAFRGDYDHSSRTYFDDENTVTYSHGKTNEFGFRTTIKSGQTQGGWSVSAFGRNVTNQRYRTQVINITSAPQAVYNMPRTFGLEGRYEW